MYDFGRALEGLLWIMFISMGVAIALTIYIIWQTFFGFTPWDTCSKMTTDASKIQCMEVYYE